MNPWEGEKLQKMLKRGLRLKQDTHYNKNEFTVWNDMQV